MDQNFNNFNNQNSGNNGGNAPYSNPFDQSQQNAYNSYEQNTQQNFGQQPYGQQFNNAYQTQQYNAYGQQYSPMYQEDKSVKKFAIASLVLSIVSILCCGLITAPLGIIFGAISLKKQPKNNGLALAGVIVGVIGLVGTIISIAYLNCVGGYEQLLSEAMICYSGLF